MRPFKFSLLRLKDGGSWRVRVRVLGSWRAPLKLDHRTVFNDRANARRFCGFLARVARADPADFDPVGSLDWQVC